MENVKHMSVQWPLSQTFTFIAYFPCKLTMTTETTWENCWLISATFNWATFIANYYSDCLTVITRRTMIVSRTWRCTWITAVIGSYWMSWTATTHALILKWKFIKAKEAKTLSSIRKVFVRLSKCHEARDELETGYTSLWRIKCCSIQ
jgi:hypothetical protein